MAREITHHAEGPYIIDEDEFEEQGRRVAVCQCGLSGNKPYCDGSHSVCADEEAGIRYKYDGDDDESPRRILSDD